MAERNDRGVIKKVILICARDLRAELRLLNSRRELLEAGHKRFQIIDNLMEKKMGPDVRKYWGAQTETYRSLLRRKVWEKALAGIGNRGEQTAQLSAIEAYLELDKGESEK